VYLALDAAPAAAAASAKEEEAALAALSPDERKRFKQRRRKVRPARGSQGPQAAARAGRAAASQNAVKQRLGCGVSEQALHWLPPCMQPAPAHPAVTRRCSSVYISCVRR